MLNLDAEFFKKWRETWGTDFESRQEAEKRNRDLESLVDDNILKNGAKFPKDVLAEIVEWKHGEWGKETAADRKKEFVRGNEEHEVKEAIDTVLKELKVDPGNAANLICLLTNLTGVGIPVASAFLRFLDPVNHKYGVIDRNVAKFLNDRDDIIRFKCNFELDEKSFIKYSFRNLLEYQNYHNWLQEKAKELELEGTTYADIDGKQQPFRPVDIEMAIFAYMRNQKMK